MNGRPLALALSLLATSSAGCSRASNTATPAQGAAPSGSPAATTAPAAAAGALTVEDPRRDELLTPGTRAPRFRAVAHDGRAVQHTGMRERPLVVYFYPRDETPGCTVEAQGFRDLAREYESAGVDVVGVSTDREDAHRAFATHHGLGFALVSDPEAALAGAFGVRVRMGFAQRVTFVIAKSGVVTKVFESVTPAGHATEVLAAARATLQ